MITISSCITGSELFELKAAQNTSLFALDIAAAEWCIDFNIPENLKRVMRDFDACPTREENDETRFTTDTPDSPSTIIKNSQDGTPRLSDDLVIELFALVLQVLLDRRHLFARL
jgi:hypothetical protein